MTDTLRISCMVFRIVAGAVIFARFPTLTRLPYVAAEWIRTLALHNGMVSRAARPGYVVSILLLMISPYWTVLVLSDLVR
jgi:C4-dicarboxylate transporter DctM subunit